MILKKIYNSIAFRISISIATVVAATTIVVGYLILRDEKNILELELHKKGAYLANILSHDVKEPLLYEERHRIYSLLNAFMIDEDSLVVYAEVYDKDRGAVVSVFNNEMLQKENVQPYDFEESLNGINIVEDNKLHLHHVSLPITVDTLGTIGYIRLGITNEFLYRTLGEVKQKLYLISAAVICIGIMLGLWMARRILSPILILNKGVKMVGEGEVGVEIPVVGEGEIKELALSFNKMSVKLKELIDEIKEAQENLVRTEKLYAIGEFSAGVAHEIKNPLTSIKMLIHTVAQKKQAVSSKDFAVIEGEINRIDRIIKEFVALARPKRSEKTDVNVNNILEDVVLLTRTQMKQSRIRLACSFLNNLPQVKGNHDSIKQVFLNLVLNALQAMNGDGGTLTIETSVNNGSVQTMITDTGFGIPESNLKKIFDPFFTTKADGTGMGLAIAHNIVSDHSGKLNIESKPEIGTIVKVVLPL
jgi:signal transduction histidine kinase